MPDHKSFYMQFFVPPSFSNKLLLLLLFTERNCQSRHSGGCSHNEVVSDVIREDVHRTKLSMTS